MPRPAKADPVPNLQWQPFVHHRLPDGSKREGHPFFYEDPTRAWE